MVVSLVTMLQPVRAKEKLSKLVGSSGSSKSRPFQENFAMPVPAPTQADPGRHSRDGGRGAFCS